MSIGVLHKNMRKNCKKHEDKTIVFRLFSIFQRRNTILRSRLPVKQNGEPVTRDHNHPVTHRHIAGNRTESKMLLRFRKRGTLQNRRNYCESNSFPINSYARTPRPSRVLFSSRIVFPLSVRNGHSERRFPFGSTA